MAVLNFLKSIIFPTKMTRYRYMSVLISICIFVLASYILAIPSKYYITNKIDSLIEENNYLGLQGIKEIPYNVEIDSIITEIQDKQCYANGEFTLQCDNLKTTTESGEIVDIRFYQNTIKYVNDEGRNINILFVIDYYVKDSDEFKRQYYPQTDYVYDKEKFPDLENTDYYLILLWPDSIYYQTYPFGVDTSGVKRDEEIIQPSYSRGYFTNIGFDVKNFEKSGQTAGLYLTQQIAAGYIPNYTNSYSILTFFFCVAFPLILVFLFWLFFRKTGKLKTFKEYYNIAAIASILPTIITFIVIWFAPGIISNLYLFGFSAFYLVVLYRINSSVNIA